LGGFGLGFAIDGAPTAEGELGSEGVYGWGGIFNTLFWVDPEQHLIGIMMTQLLPNTTDIQDKFRIMTYQTIVER
jgi:CubicO group peptidase (beta-lactamase class C family)